MKKVGRPKLYEDEKSQTQLIAVYKADYLDFKKKVESNVGDVFMTDILGVMMRMYQPGNFKDEIEEFRNNKKSMRRDKYKEILLEKDFILKDSQEAWAQHRGQEYKFTHPDYKRYFYLKRTSDDLGSPYGFNAQVTNGKAFDKIVPHNAVDTFRGKGLFMWVDEAFVELMDKL